MFYHRGHDIKKRKRITFNKLSLRGIFNRDSRELFFLKIDWSILAQSARTSFILSSRGRSEATTSSAAVQEAFSRASIRGMTSTVVLSFSI